MTRLLTWNYQRQGDPLSAFLCTVAWSGDCREPLESALHCSRRWGCTKRCCNRLCTHPNADYLVSKLVSNTIPIPCKPEFIVTGMGRGQALIACPSSSWAEAWEVQLGGAVLPGCQPCLKCTSVGITMPLVTLTSCLLDLKAGISLCKLQLSALGWQGPTVVCLAWASMLWKRLLFVPLPYLSKATRFREGEALTQALLNSRSVSSLL